MPDVCLSLDETPLVDQGEYSLHRYEVSIIPYVHRTTSGTPDFLVGSKSTPRVRWILTNQVHMPSLLDGG